MKHTAFLLLSICLLSSAVVAAPPEILFSGVRTVDTEDLENAARHELFFFRHTLEASRAEDAAFEMEAYYKKRGYPLARVEGFKVDRGALFLVREGPLVLMEHAEIVGAENLDPDTLSKFVVLPRSGLLGLVGSRLYVQAGMDTAAQHMLSYLKQSGYLEAEVLGPEVPRLDEIRKMGPGAFSGMEIPAHSRYEIKEGPRALITSIEIRGNAKVTESELREVLDPRIGAPYSPFTPFDLEALVTERYGVRGFAFAKCEVQETFDRSDRETSVSVTLLIEEGPLTRVGNVIIGGNFRADDEVVRRELSFWPGSKFGSRRLTRSQEWLRLTGLFHRVGFEVVTPSDEVLRDAEVVDADIRVDVSEKDKLQVETTVGWGSWDQLRGSVSFNWRNLDGGARSLSLKLDGSFRGWGANVTYSEPWLLPGILGRTTGSAEALYENREYPTYSFNREAAGFTLSRLWLQNKPDGYKFSGSFGYTYSYTDVFEVTGDVPKEFENTTKLGSLALTVVRSALDNFFAPTEGSVLTTTLQVADKALLSDLNFLRVIMGAAVYLPLGDTILVVRGRVGATDPYGDTSDLPVQERFYLGGNSTVRSFSELDLGPRLIEDDGSETDSASGGEFFSVFNVELRYPITGGLEGAAFIDAGNVIRSIDDVELKGYRFAIGGGLRYPTPVGPLRVDFGFNPNPRSDEQTWAIYFAVGYPF